MGFVNPQRVFLEYVYVPYVAVLNRIIGFFLYYRTSVIGWLSTFKIVLWLEKQLQNACVTIVQMGPIPNHISFIMDGNRRYAKAYNIPIKKGHEAGGINLLSLVYACKKMGVKCVSAYAFSIENFNRPKEEVETLTKLFAEKLDEFANRAQDFQDPLYGTRLKIVGDFSLLSDEMITRIKNVEEITKTGNDFTFYICYPYTSRNEIFKTMYSVVEKEYNKNNQQQNGLKDTSTIGHLNIKDFSNSMYFDNFSDKCDLLVRTSGHLRLSDYMLWQSHESSTIEFSDKLWPEFTFINLYLMILKWSFYKTLEKYDQDYHPLRDFMFKRWKKAGIDIKSLPSPPATVSITGEGE